MTPQSPSAIKGFYEGLSEGEPIPWGPWIEPLAVAGGVWNRIRMY